MIMLTGGAGFIGSALLWGLNNQGIDDIVVVDRLGDGAKWKNTVKRKYFKYLHKDELKSWLTGPGADESVETVFHLGASTSTTESNVDYLVKNNLEYSQYLFRFCRDKGIPFIYASSAATYGNGDNGYNDEHGVIDRLRPINPYGYSKQLFDQWVLGQKEAPPRWYGLKFFNVYGPQEYHKGPQASVAYHAYNDVLAAGAVKLFKSYRDDCPDGMQKRDFVYVKDAVGVLLHLHAVKGSTANGIYNVGTGQARSFLDLAGIALKAMGKSGDNIEWIEMPEEIKNQYQYHTEAPMAKLRQQAGYSKGFACLEEGVADYIANYLQGRDRYL
ncbi:MAG TPA: ADP-glyceromanno-heptose 6-epimerase [candidate division Zixibacteria bacterium]|nr:ADP-glyceromanno-heptose 6-epimerase [candidate division Zixibacteria bacterium]